MPFLNLPNAIGVLAIDTHMPLAVDCHAPMVAASANTAPQMLSTASTPTPDLGSANEDPPIKR